MAIEQANAFRTFVNENESVQDQIREAASAKDESFSLISLAAEHGYSFTAEEAASAWEPGQRGELSDFELEMVAGGVAPLLIILGKVIGGAIAGGISGGATAGVTHLADQGK